MDAKALLVLEDGAVYEGAAFGARGTAVGEVVFNTSMTGYQEMLTDPSYAGQILMPTYPLIGNYGINDDDFESKRTQVSAFIVREACDQPNQWQSKRTLHEYLAAQGIPGIAGVDTRAVTRRLRNRGVMMGMVTSEHDASQAVKVLHGRPRYGDIDFVKAVSTAKPYAWELPQYAIRPLKITLVDLGVKNNIMRLLRARGCAVGVLPATVTAEDVLATKPDGVLLSPGPGDPALLGYAIDTARGLIGRVPLMGICLGHQIVAHAVGGRTFKLKFGHRGGNHPVQDLQSGCVRITAQNHGYAVDPDNLPADVVVSHVNLNDGTVEGLRHTSVPLFTIQYHSEASPGPEDNVGMFDDFVSMVREHGKPEIKR